MITAHEPATGFAPIAAAHAHTLILGTLPSQASLSASEYYAHPRNAFWRIMRELFGVEGDYNRRAAMLANEGIAVWDVLHRSVRPGSLDADIDLATAEANAFPAFFDRHPGIRLVCFNGQKAAELYRRYVLPDLDRTSLRYATLPSTSPAHAAMSFEAKLEAWRGIIAGKHNNGEST